MNLIDVVRQFQTDDECLDYIEQVRWPTDKCCIRCGSVNISRFNRKTASKNKRDRLYECLEPNCAYQFSVTAGTIFADSHLQLTKWFMATALIVEAKKGISAKQVARHLGMESSYKTVWYLCHRIREAMKHGETMLSGEVEADETYIGPRKPRKGRPYVKKDSKDVVLGIVERGGQLRLIPVKDAKMEIIGPVLQEHVSQDVSTIYTDDSATYAIFLGRNYPGKHKIINHSRTYAVGDTHTQHIENAFSLLKRGIYGTFHKVSIKHLARYCNEFSYRFNRRGEQTQLFDATLKGLVYGKALKFSDLTAQREEL